MSSRTSCPEQTDVLVVDDDPRNCRLLEGYLRSEGYRVRKALDGETALGLARERVPDVVLLDVMMPGMDGHEVCRILKHDPRTRLTQIMMVTALDGTSNRVQGLDTGADDYLPKPVRREEFLARLRSLARARRLLVELEEARSALAARNEELELKKTLAQTLVHDLKSPLAAVVGNLDLLGRRADERAQELVGRCRSGASRMLRMIMDLLDVDGLEEGRMQPAVERVDLTGLARLVVDEASVAAAQRSLRIVLEASGAPCAVQADPMMLRRVFDNLLANAMEHSPSGTIVTLRVAAGAHGIEVHVADQGPGIPESQRENIFEKYARLELRKAGLVANRGLGLTFCRLAVEAHGGTIRADSGGQGGAVLRFTLPAAKSVEEAAVA